MKLNIKLNTSLIDFSRVDVSGLDPFETQFVKMNKEFSVKSDEAVRAGTEFTNLCDEIERMVKQRNELKDKVLSVVFASFDDVIRLNEFANTLTTEQRERVKQRLLAAATPDAPTPDAPTQ